MRKILLMVAVAMLAALAMFAQDKGGPPKGGKGGKGGPPKNLKVLTPENLMDNMRSFVPALGVADKGGCNFCHEMDRSSDAKPEKVMARMMIMMVNDINSKFP